MTMRKPSQAVLIWGLASLALFGCMEPASTPATVKPEGGSTPRTLVGTGELDSGYLHGKTKIYFQRYENALLWQGDIALAPEDVTRGPASAKVASTGRLTYSDRWPNGKIPFVMDPATPNQSLIYQSMEYWQARSNIRFINRTTEKEYVKISSWSGCASTYIGRRTESYQEMWIGANCFEQQIQHELGHVIGMHHEQTRTDRDNYVNIYPDRMESDGCRAQYVKYAEAGNWDGIDVGAFDYYSRMIYFSTHCAKDISLPTMTKKDGTSIPGGVVLSGGDLAGARYAYSLKYSSRRRDFNGDGLNDLIYFDWKLRTANVAYAIRGAQSFNNVGRWIEASQFHSLWHGEYRIGNFNNDNLADVMFISTTGELHVKLNTGGGLGASSMWLSQYQLSALDKHGIYYVGDFNGDNLDDIGCAYSTLEAGRENTFRVAFSTGNGFQAPVTFLNSNAMGTSQSGEYLVGYFNNDNKADLMWIGNAGNVHVRTSNGAGLNQLQTWKSAGTFGDLNRGGEYLVGDLTCDGLDDLLFVDPVDNSGWASYSTGSGLGSNVNWISPGTFGNRGKGEYLMGLHGDPRPDGSRCADLLYIRGDGQITGKQSTGTSFSATATYMGAGSFGRPWDGGQYH